jgi:hypothetical protein
LTPYGLLKQVLLMTWLWAIFGGFYLVAYVFWVPHLFGNALLVIAAGGVTLAVGASLLGDGFARALELQASTTLPPIPLVRVRRALGGMILLAFVSVYLPPQGRIVAHWPLDLAITIVSGVIMIAYAVMDV